MKNAERTNASSNWRRTARMEISRKQLKNWAANAQSTANRMKMVLADGVETRDIYRIAAERQVRIRRLNFRRDTLEDIFLKAMES